MDLQTAVGVSMLGCSRIRASSVYKDLRQQDPFASLVSLLAALGVAPDAQRELADAAALEAAAALTAGAGAEMEPIAWFDPRFPALLNCVADPPPVLWTRGQAAVLAQPAVAARLRSLGTIVAPSSPAELDGFIRAEVARYTALAQAAGITLD